MIITLDDLGKIREVHKSKKIVLGKGTFDLLHRGHITYLKLLREHGDIVVVVISSNQRVIKYKGPARPIQDEKDRALILDAIKYVDYVVIGSDVLLDTMVSHVAEMLKPDLYLAMKDIEKLRDELTEIGVPQLCIDCEKENSTTAIVEKVRSSLGS